MYQIEKTTEVFRDNPWCNPCEDRITKLVHAKKAGLKTVAFVYPEFDSSTFRYRGYNVSETLEYSFYWKASYFSYAERKKLSSIMQYIDVVVLIRCFQDESMDAFIDSIRKNAVKLCYDIDDMVYHPKCISDLKEALGLKQNLEINFWSGQMYRNQQVAEQCDCFITTNGFLQGYLMETFQKPCFIIPNYLNWYQERVSMEYFEKKQKTDTIDPFVIGYFSGSPTHVKDLGMIMPEIEQFLKKHDNAMLKVVGYMDLPDQWDYLKSDGKMVFTAFQSFTGLQYEQAKVDVNVVPLVNNLFSNCKSELKYFENAIVGTVTCATPTYSFQKAIESGSNGYLCNEGEWYGALEKIYQDSDNRKMQLKIRESALNCYGNRNQLNLVESVLKKTESI